MCKASNSCPSKARGARLRNKKLALVGLGFLALAGVLAMVLSVTGDSQSVRDVPAGSHVRFEGELVPLPSLPQAAELQPHLANATYLLASDGDVRVLVTLDAPASGHVVVDGVVRVRLQSDGSGHPLLLVRGRIL